MNWVSERIAGGGRAEVVTGAMVWCLIGVRHRFRLFMLRERTMFTTEGAYSRSRRKEGLIQLFNYPSGIYFGVYKGPTTIADA